MVSSAGTLSTPAGFTSRSPQVNMQGCYLFDKLVASGNATDTPSLTQGGACNATWLIAEYSGITGVRHLERQQRRVWRQHGCNAVP